MEQAISGTLHSLQAFLTPLPAYSAIQFKNGTRRVQKNAMPFCKKLRHIISIVLGWGDFKNQGWVLYTVYAVMTVKIK